MLSHIAEWAATVLATGVIAGLVVVAAGATGGWFLYRWVRRRVAGATARAIRYARHNAVGSVAGGRVRLPPRVVYELRRRINGPPEML
jgi:hypothetical protein